MTERFVIQSQPPDDQDVVTGVNWLVSYALEHSHESAVLAVNTLEQVGPQAIGRSLPKLANLLRTDRHGRAQTERGEVEIYLMTGKRTKGTVRSALHLPALAVWPTEGLIDNIEDSAPAALCVIPWLEQNIAKWKRAYSPTDLKTGVAEKAPWSSSLVAQRALKSMTYVSNVTNNGLATSYEHDSALEMLHILKGANERFDPDELEALAIGLNWPPRAAAKLREMAHSVLSGKRLRFREPGRHWTESVLEEWRKPTSRSGF